MTHILSQSELDHLASIYGANVENWPDFHREGAYHALAAGLKISEDEALLDNYLNGALAVPAPSDLLSARILKAAQAERLETQGQHTVLVAANENTPSLFKKWRMAGVAAAALFVVGTAVYPNMSTPTEDEVLLAAASELGFDEIYEWILSEET